ncbi:predicted protein [Streptomyces albidoflavus]|nr:predicted protein [Streptomyces albidoflavus]
MGEGPRGGASGAGRLTVSRAGPAHARLEDQPCPLTKVPDD